MTATHRRTLISAVILAYTAGIVATNVLSTYWPAVDVCGLIMPAGAFAAGLVLSFRDLVHDTLGTRASLIAVLVGTALAGLTSSPRIAGVSAIAFAVSETVDALVYAALRTRSRLLAATTSNLTGLTIDSLLFVPLAFGTATAIPGHLLAKTAATFGAVAVLSTTRPTAG